MCHATPTIKEYTMSQQSIPYTLNPLFIKYLATLDLLIADKKRKPFHAVEISTKIYNCKIIIEQCFGVCFN